MMVIMPKTNLKVIGIMIYVILKIMKFRKVRVKKS